MTQPTVWEAFEDAIRVWEGGFQDAAWDSGNWVEHPEGPQYGRRLIGTNCGVTPKTLAQWRGISPWEVTEEMIKGLEMKEAVEIGVKLYYIAPLFYRLPWNAATWVWTEMGWGSGPWTIIKMMQKKIGATQDGVIGPKTAAAYQEWLGKASLAERVSEIADHRCKYYEHLVKIRPANKPAMQGWLNRANYYRPENTEWWKKWQG